MNHTMTKANKMTLDQIVTRMKTEILEDIARGYLPRMESLSSFSDLHDYVDANEYGGFCDEDVTDELTREFDDSTDALYALLNFMNQAQGEVDSWIREFA
jgi:hypothetical protein